MVNKFNMSNTMSTTTGKVHKMPTIKTDDVKHVSTRAVTTTKTSPQSDTTGVKITKDSLTQALHNTGK